MSNLMLNRLLTYLQYKILRLQRKGYKFKFDHAYAVYRSKPVNIHSIIQTPSGKVFEKTWWGDTFCTRDMFNDFRNHINYVERNYG